MLDWAHLAVILGMGFWGFILPWKVAFGLCNFWKLGFGMALLVWYPSSFSLLQSPELSSIPKSSISKTLVAVQSATNYKNHAVSISSASPGLRYPCLRCCSTDDESPSARIFIKGDISSSTEAILFLFRFSWWIENDIAFGVSGNVAGLPESSCEGNLKKAFSQFGEVSKGFSSFFFNFFPVDYLKPDSTEKSCTDVFEYMVYVSQSFNPLIDATVADWFGEVFFFFPLRCIIKSSVLFWPWCLASMKMVGWMKLHIKSFAGTCVMHPLLNREFWSM